MDNDQVPPIAPNPNRGNAEPDAGGIAPRPAAPHVGGRGNGAGPHGGGARRGNTAREARAGRRERRKGGRGVAAAAAAAAAQVEDAAARVLAAGDVRSEAHGHGHGPNVAEAPPAQPPPEPPLPLPDATGEVLRWRTEAVRRVERAWAKAFVPFQWFFDWINVSVFWLATFGHQLAENDPNIDRRPDANSLQKLKHGTAYYQVVIELVLTRTVCLALLFVTMCVAVPVVWSYIFYQIFGLRLMVPAMVTAITAVVGMVRRRCPRRVVLKRTTVIIELQLLLQLMAPAFTAVAAPDMLLSVRNGARRFHPINNDMRTALNPTGVLPASATYSLAERLLQESVDGISTWGETSLFRAILTRPVLYGYRVTEMAPMPVQRLKPGMKATVRDVAVARKPLGVALPVYFHGFARPKPDPNDPWSMLHGMLTRVGRQPNARTPINARAFECFVRRWLNDNLEPVPWTDEPDLEDYLAQTHYNERDKQMIRDAVHEHDPTRLDALYRNAKAFTKDETYDGWKANRIIMSRPLEFKGEFGPYVHLVEKILYRTGYLSRE